MVKMGNFNKAPFTATLKVYQYRNSIPLLVEVERHVVSKHLPDDPDKFASTMSEGVVVGPSFRDLLFIVGSECDVVLNNIMS